MEPLAQTIALARPKGLLWKQLQAAGRWAIRFPANDGVVFSYVLEGTCLCRAYGQLHALGAGDFVMLVRPPDWILGSDAAAPVIEYRPDHLAAAQLGLEQGGPVTVTVGGRFVFDAVNTALLTELLPPFTLLRGADAGAGRLGALLGLLGDEAKTERPGQGFALERLMELLLVEVIRSPHASALPPQPGLLRGLADPQVARALRALHADVGRRWQVAELASQAGMSRSGFAAHFAATIGLPPIDYLLRWRMALAKDALRNGGLKLAEVAEQIGYGSVSAFSIAFTRSVGCPPSVFRR